MQRTEWMARFLRCYVATIRVLEAIRAESGYGYKDVAAVDVADFKDYPVWCDGQVEIGYNNEPEAIAHELGHGVHEAIRDTGKKDMFGEEFAEAVRFYVETQMDTESNWLRRFGRHTNPFTRNYTFQQFLTALNRKSCFNALAGSLDDNDAPSAPIIVVRLHRYGDVWCVAGGRR